MNKLTAALLLSAVLLCACATDSPPAVTDLTSASDTASVGSEAETSAAPEEKEFTGYALTVKSVRLLPGEVADVEALLGKPSDKLEAPSCVHPGNDVVYYYDGLEVVTSPNAAGKSYITSITVTSDSIKTEEGIAIGSTLADATAACGDYDKTKSVPDFGRYLFLKGRTSITLLTDPDNTVTSISYSFEG